MDFEVWSNLAKIILPVSFSTLRLARRLCDVRSVLSENFSVSHNKTEVWKTPTSWLGGGFKDFLYFHPDPWENDPIWHNLMSIFFKRVEITKQLIFQFRLILQLLIFFNQYIDIEKHHFQSCTKKSVFVIHFCCPLNVSGENTQKNSRFSWRHSNTHRNTGKFVVAFAVFHPCRMKNRVFPFFWCMIQVCAKQQFFPTNRHINFTKTNGWHPTFLDRNFRLPIFKSGIFRVGNPSSKTPRFSPLNPVGLGVRFWCCIPCTNSPTWE